MTSSIRRAAEKQDLEQRHAAAIAALAEGAGVDPPAIRTAGDDVIGSMSVDVFVLEQLQMLATEIESLRSELAAGRRGTGKGKK